MTLGAMAAVFRQTNGYQSVCLRLEREGKCVSEPNTISKEHKPPDCLLAKGPGSWEKDGGEWGWKTVVKMLRDLAFFPSLMPGDGKVNKVFYFCINKAFSGPSFQPTLIYYLSF